MNLRAYCERALSAIDEWEASWGPYDSHSSLAVDEDRLEEAFGDYLERLKGNYPFFHPRYAGQMLKPPHPVAIAGYLAAMRINPNNHALDGGPPTGEMEKEVIDRLAAMIGLPDAHLGHLTGGGTVANLEALWIARELHPDRPVLLAESAHYTHRRAADLLGLELEEVPVGSAGRMDVAALERRLEKGAIGTVVVTAGTTGRGAVDPIARVLELADRHEVRVHADAAYGGFFAPLARAGSDLVPGEDLRALSRCDSVVVDPHKHGLQPYGCGCVLFSDPAVGRFYRHDSPYTYFTSEELHLGEISLECSRPGAAAGALWLTLRVLPPKAEEGLGPILEAGLRAARALEGRLEDSVRYAAYGSPDLDLLVYHPIPPCGSTSGSVPGSGAGPDPAIVDEASASIFRLASEEATAGEGDPIFLSVVREPADRFLETVTAGGGASSVPSENGPPENGLSEVRLLRSVLMKPSHEGYVEHLHDRLEELAQIHFSSHE